MKEGKRLFVSDWLAVNWRLNAHNETKVGWTVPGYVGTAVVRNRLKRWLKEYLAKKWNPKLNGLEVHFLFKRYKPSFYKNLDHDQFDQVIGLGLKNVERKQKVAK